MKGRTGAAMSVAVLALAAFGSACVPTAATRDPRSTAETTRVLPWTGGDRLGVEVGADVRYVPGADAQVTVTGPRDEVQDIVVDNGEIRRAHAYGWRWRWRREPYRRVRIVVRAPRLSAASLGGSGRLDLGQLSQDEFDLVVSGSGRATAGGAINILHLVLSGSGGAEIEALKAKTLDASLSGSGWMTVAGACDALRLWISGSGRADMSGLDVGDADAVLSGSGLATLAPRRSAHLQIAGSGGVRLTTDPTQLAVQRSGSGWVIRPNGAT